MVAFVNRVIVLSVIVVADANRNGCPIKQPSPKKSPAFKIATTASFPCVEETTILTLPLLM